MTAGMMGALPARADSTSDAALGALEVSSVVIHVPAGASASQPLRVLVVLHGMGGNGDDFSRPFVSSADANGWIMVAPTIQYGDWTDPAQVAQEGPHLIAWLTSYLDSLPAQTGLPVAQRVLLLGHSRGAQLALRFAEFHPDRVRAVAALSAGTYTLPLAQDATSQPLPFPFGVADLAAHDGGQPFDAARFDSVPLWIGVGGEDTNPADLPRAWDPYLGTTRVQRARAFVGALRQLGATVSLTVFPGDSHALTPDMQQAACSNLQRALTAGTSPAASS